MFVGSIEPPIMKLKFRSSIESFGAVIVC